MRHTPLRVLFCNATRSWGGVKTWMLQLAQWLQENGHDVQLACRRGDLMVEKCQKLGLKCHEIDFSADYSPFTVAKFYKLLKHQNSDVLITNVGKGLRTAGVAAKLAGVLHVNRLGSYGDLKNRPRDRWEYNQLVDRVFVCSDSLFEYFHNHRPFLQKKLKRFHNAVSVANLIEPQSTEGPVQLATLARLSARKQTEKIIDCLHSLKDLDWHFHIGGFGPEEEALKRQVNELGLQDRVTFHGRVQQTEFLKDKHVGLLYSNEEAFGLAILEYMAAGLAVIASRVGGVPEIIEEGHSGILVDPKNIQSLTEALCSIMSDPEQRLRIAQQGQERLRQSFNTDLTFAAIVADFQESIRKKA